MSDEIESIKEQMKRGSNPRDFKARLAEEIVASIYGKEKATEASEQFLFTFKEGSIPDDAAKTSVVKGEKLVDILLRRKLFHQKAIFVAL